MPVSAQHLVVGMPASVRITSRSAKGVDGVWRGVLSPVDGPAASAGRDDDPAGVAGRAHPRLAVRPDTTVLKQGTSDLTPMSAAFAKHHAVTVIACRPRSGNRKGVVEKNSHTAAQRWWRTVPDEFTAEQAQAGFEAFARGQDDRPRQTETGKTTAKVMFAAERLWPLPPAVACGRGPGRGDPGAHHDLARHPSPRAPRPAPSHQLDPRELHRQRKTPPSRSGNINNSTNGCRRRQLVDSRTPGPR